MSMRDQLIGTWRLLSYETEKDGEKVYPFGEDAKGFIMYNPDGYMSAQLSKVGRTPYESGDIHTGTKEEMAEAAHGYMAYSGRFEVDEEKGEVTHHMDVSMNPTWEGQAQPRVGQIDGKILSIYNGLHPEDQLKWERVEPHE
ncbi:MULTISPECIES: lipocalin-like domain-containing protein [Aerococcus]|uniref:lipocalin-like domain-containing protein n=1 Tax=Aerococcus TaxID=1375 RepID=UPI000200EF01|nr:MULTISPECIES: lipocalin-like domain-containing protein [Aerococcus]AEA00700.1 hypothetical protein HMPREF9243_0368 [Aerococcus sp. Group 1]MCY3030700.1 lipocalin-like domain-containing protein [Aerococcus sp. Group 1]MCY3054331.1 lipocalin-like domain-containing protein [Aerococcus sp. Group 1]MCY3056061.1 lipocalin-like domain-containing protein [Aerococcus sp. Group 1]MCY3062031.1 lipocalin-like domain-containing protein [Aerococcus sp. Group 1]